MYKICHSPISKKSSIIVITGTRDGQAWSDSRGWLPLTTLNLGHRSPTRCVLFTSSDRALETAEEARRELQMLQSRLTDSRWQECVSLLCRLSDPSGYDGLLEIRHHLLHSWSVWATICRISSMRSRIVRSTCPRKPVGPPLAERTTTNLTKHSVDPSGLICTLETASASHESDIIPRYFCQRVSSVLESVFWNNVKDTVLQLCFVSSITRNIMEHLSWRHDEFGIRPARIANCSGYHGWSPPAPDSSGSHR